MERAMELVVHHGGLAVFVVIFLDQLGVPIPSIPLLLGFGALAGAGKLDPLRALLLAVVASMCADFAWFQLGRWKGTRVLGLLCRASLEPDSCVSKTHDLFGRHGVKSLLVAKFIPGFDTVAPPLAAMLGVRASKFLIWSTAGAVLWLLVYGGLGYAFSERIAELAAWADRFGSSLGLIVLALFVAWLAWKYAARQRVLRTIRMARITVDELNELILTGRVPTILDARSRAALDAFPFMIQGAQFVSADELNETHVHAVREKEIVVYCS
jgi:membrane protein DedA with SNARE-associated domain